MNRAFYVLGWGYVAVCSALVLKGRRGGGAVGSAPTGYAPTVPGSTAPYAAAQWFRRVKPYCNSVEVMVLQRQDAPPRTVDGAGYQAACFALAGRIDDARRIIDALPNRDRYKAAGIVFEIGHPIADAGDDRSAGPIMELVVDYWPNHYMALYHAGMAEYMLGQRDVAKHNLQAFLSIYRANDGWHRNGVDVLRRLEDTTATRADARRPREP